MRKYFPKMKTSNVSEHKKNRIPKIGNGYQKTLIKIPRNEVTKNFIKILQFFELIFLSRS